MDINVCVELVFGKPIYARNLMILHPSAHTVTNICIYNRKIIYICNGPVQHAQPHNQYPMNLVLAATVAAFKTIKQYVTVLQVYFFWSGSHIHQWICIRYSFRDTCENYWRNKPTHLWESLMCAIQQKRQRATRYKKRYYEFFSLHFSSHLFFFLFILKWNK